MNTYYTNKEYGVIEEMDIGSRIKQLRTSDGYMVEEVAEYLGLSVDEYKDIESNKRLFDTTVLDAICNLYMVEEEYIINGMHIPDPNRLRLKY